jgi:hypothetical protein
MNLELIMKMAESRFHAGLRSELKVGGLMLKTPCRPHLNAVYELFLGSGLQPVVSPLYLGVREHV